MSAPNPLNPWQENLLVCQAQVGDLSAFRTLVQAYETRLLYFIRRFVADEHRAADVLQDVWLVALQKIRSLKSPAAFRSWIYQIAHARAVTNVRREGPTTHSLPFEIADDEVESVTEFIRHEQALAVHQALTRLSADHRAVLVLRFLEDLKLVEIAQVLSESLGTVKSRLHYAKESLRRLLSEEFIDE